MSQVLVRQRGEGRVRRASVVWVAALAIATFFAMFAIVKPAAADDVVGNPGPVNFELVGGALAIGDGSILPPVDISDLGEEAPVLSGNVDAEGNVTIPKENVVFPDLPLQESISVADVDLLITILAANDGTGHVDPTTGEVNLDLDLRIELRGTIALSGQPPSVLNDDGRCNIGPIPLRLTSGTTSMESPPEGWAPITGIPYDVDEARIVDNAFAVPSLPAGACEKIAGVIDIAGVLNGQVGLPLGAGMSSAELQIKTSPRITKPGEECEDCGRHNLSVNTSGEGSGNVSATPTGPVYAEGTTVTLTATPDTGSTFAGWTGCDSVPDGKCVVTMNADRTVTADFGKEVTPPCPDGQVGTPPDCVKPPCPDGQIGTPPDCVKPPVGKANLKISVKPKNRTVKRGRSAVIKVPVKNIGKAQAQKTKVCVNAPKKLVKVKRCVNLGAIAPNKTKVAKFKVTVKKKAKKGKRAALRFTATAKGVKAKKGNSKIRVK